MNDQVSAHYTAGGALADRIADGLRKNGVKPCDLRASDLEAVAEFHFRGRAATLELVAQMNLTVASEVLDIGSGWGGLALANELKDEFGKRTIQQVVDYCLGLRETHGTTYFEGKVSESDLDQNIALMQALRDALGPGAMLRIDSNQAFSVPSAIHLARALEGLVCAALAPCCRAWT